MLQKHIKNFRKSWKCQRELEFSHSQLMPLNNHRNFNRHQKQSEKNLQFVTNSPKRKNESPENISNIDKRHRSNMQTNENHQQSPTIQESINKILENMAAMNANLSCQIGAISTRLDSLADELKAIRSTQSILQHTVSEVTSDVTNLKDKVHEIDVLRNQLEQEQLKDDISIVGVPAYYGDKHEELLDSINRACELSLSKKSFKFIRFVNKKKLDRGNVYMRFINHSEKASFMARVTSLSKDANGKRQPIVVEDFFTEHQDNPSSLTGKQMYIVNSLTPANREILKLKHQYKSQIHFMWEQDGRILMKYNQSSRVIQAYSTFHVHHFAKQSPNMLQQ